MVHSFVAFWLRILYGLVFMSPLMPCRENVDSTTTVSTTAFIIVRRLHSSGVNTTAAVPILMQFNNATVNSRRRE